MGKKLLLIPVLFLIFFPISIWGQCPTSVSLSSDVGNTICEGAAVVFTATSNNGTSPFTYQWKIDGTNTGSATTDNTFSSSTLTNGQKISVVVTDANGTTCSVSSSNFTMTVNTNKTPTVNVSASPSTKCIGEIVTFTASNTNAGASPSYSWYINSSSTPAQTSSSNTFSISSLPAGANSVRVVLTSSLTCVTSSTAETTSNITITGNSTISNPANKDQSTVCINTPIDPIVFSIGGSGSGAGVSGLPPGVNGNYSGGNFTISGSPTTAGTFNYTVTATGPCESATETGTITIVKDATIDLTSANNQQEVCQDEAITNITYNIGETGTGATLTGLPTGFSGDFSGGVYTIIGSSAVTGTHNFTITATGTCGDSQSLNGSITVNENLTPSVSIVSSDTDNTICEGTEVTFTATQTNGGTSPSYQWKVGTTTVGNDSDTFMTNTLALGDQSVSVVLTSNETCLTQATATSNSIVTTVNKNLTPEVSVSASDSDICDGDSIEFTATPINGGTSPAYQWKVDGNNVGTNSNTFTTTSLADGQSVTVVLTSNETCLATPTATSEPLATTVNPNLTPEVSITSNDTNNIICSGSSITFTASPVNGGSSPMYQWYIDGNTAGTDSSTFSPAGLTDGQIVKVLMTSNEDCLVTDTAESNEITVQVDNSLSGTTPTLDNTDPAHNPTAVCPVVSGLTYKVTKVPGAISYTWAFPSGWNITAGDGTNQVTVTATSSAQPGTFSVTASNECGFSNQFISESISTGTVVYVSAGPDQTVCRGTNSISLAGEIGGVITKSKDWAWSASVTGGDFSNGGNSLDGTYTIPTSIRNNGGTVSIKITSIDPAGTCGPKEDEMILTVLTNATISNPGNRDQTVCIDNAIADIDFSIANAGTGGDVTGLPEGLNGTYDVGVFTISGIPTESGSFNYTVSTTGSCTSQQTSQTGTITVTANHTISDPINKSQEICINNIIDDIIFSTNESVTDASVTGLPAGLTGLYSTGTYTIGGTATEAGTFDYTVTTSGNCNNTTQTGTITINPDPTIDIPTNKDQEICINTALTDIQFTITAPGNDATVDGLPDGLSGSFNNGVYTIAGSPTIAGTFDYSVTTISDCSNVSQTGQIIVNPDPTAAIEYSGEFCTTQTTTVPVSLTGTGAYENGIFSATPLGLTIDASTGEIDPGSSEPNTYTVEYKTQENCLNYSATTQVIINPTPSVDISYNIPACNNEGIMQVSFTNEIGAYKNGIFSASPGGLDIDPASGEINTNSSSPGDYIVKYLIPAANGCSEVAVTTNVSITQLPQVSISYPSEICNSETAIAVNLSVDAGEGANGVFSGTAGLEISADGTINPSNSTIGSHTVEYTVASEAGCEAVVATSGFIIKEVPVITTDPSNTGTCSNSPSQFEVIATGDDLIYQWYRIVEGNAQSIPGEDEATLYFSNVTSADAGEYYVVVSGANSCSDDISETVTLNVDEDILITEPSQDITICEDEKDQISFLFMGHANGAPLSFQWIKDGEVVTETSRIDMEVTGPDGPNGEYTGTLTITDPEPGETGDSGVYWVNVDGPDYFTCSEATSKTFTFRVEPRPGPPTVSNNQFCLNEDAGNLTAEGELGNDIKWYTFDETTMVYSYIGDNIPIDTSAPNVFEYYATQTRDNGCESDFSEALTITVLDKPDPVADAPIEFPYCYNEEVTVPLSIDPAEGATIIWYDVAAGGTALSSAPTPVTSEVKVTSYWVSQIVTETGCESDRTQVKVIINELPNLNITVADSGSQNICLGSSINLVASGATTYTWTKDGNDIGTEATLNHEPTTPGTNTYILTGVDENGCSNITEIDIELEEPSNGGVLDGPASVCIGENSGTLNLSGQLGEIVRWESSTDGTNWTPISQTTSEYSFQNLGNATSFRAVVKNGVCAEAFSNEVNITIDPLPEAGKILFKGTEKVFMMCEFPTDDYLVPLQATGTFVGEIVAWQYRRNSQTSWSTIMDDGSEPITGTTLSGQLVNEVSNNESTLFRVEVQSGACEPNVFSETATLSIIPSDIAPNPVTITRPEICLGDFIELSSGTGYGGYGTFEGGAFDNSSIANHGWRVQRYNPDTDNGTTYTFESAADNVRPERWMRTNPKEFEMENPTGGGTMDQLFDSCSCDEGNKGFAIVSGNNPSTLETPVFNTYTMDNPTLTFDQAYNLTAGDTIKVQISLDGGNTYEEEPLFVVGGPDHSENYEKFGDDGLGEPNNMSIDLSNYAGLDNLRIRWLYDGSTGGIYTIDDIGIPQDPENVQLIWYYDDDPNDPDNDLVQIGDINQGTVQYTPTKLGWNYFQVNTALVFDTNGDPCQSAENQATIQVYVFDSYTTTATANVGSCGNSEVPLQGILTGGTQGEVTEFYAEDTSTVAWTVLESPDGYTFSEDHFTSTGEGAAINDPQAVFLPPVEGEYTLEYTITPDERNTCEIINGAVTFNFVECTTLDFDGVDDYIDLETNYTGNYFIEAWIRPFDRPIPGETGNTDATKGTIISGPGFEIKMANLPASIVPNGRWYHIGVSNSGLLWVDGVASGSTTISGSGSNKTLIGARWNSTEKITENHFSGWIEEVRIWNNTPDEREIRFMMNQRIKLIEGATASTPIEGEVVPNKTVTGSYLTDTNSNNLHLESDGNLKPFYEQTWGDLAGYYRLYSNNPDPANLIPGYFADNLKPTGGYTPDHSINKVPGRMYNITTDQENTSPTPYFSGVDGTWANVNTWARPTVWDYPNSTYSGTALEWNIARINHNITSDSKIITMLGLLSQTEGKLLSINDNHPIRITHYLLLDGNMDLVDESQLLQDHGSILANSSKGWSEIDQQGRMSSYNYNYWTSPVSNQGSDNNSGYMLNQVKLDGTNPNSPVGINWQNGYYAADGAKTTPKITISNEWIWDFRGGDADIYGDWLHMGSDFLQIVGAGYSMKGTDGTVEPNTQKQNYAFRGKPNNGNISNSDLILLNNQNYLVGNPYPSAIDAWQFIKENISVNGGTNTENVFNGSVYFWDHFSGKTHILEEYIGGYAVVNLSDPVGIPAISNDWRINFAGEPESSIVPKRYIPVAQGFFLNSASVSTSSGTATFSGNIKFANTQRVFVKESGGNSIFLQHEEDLIKGIEGKNRTISSDEDLRMKIRLKFESPKGYHRQILVTRDENTSNGFDIGYDAPLIENNLEDMYWWVDESAFVIQGVSSFEKDQILPLVIKTKEGGEFKIKIDKTENWPTTKALYLNDKFNDSIHDILNENYIAETEAGEIKDRFELVFFKETAQNPDPVIPNPDGLPNIDGLVGISYSTFSKQVKISNFDLLDVSKVMIFDMGGKLIQEYDEIPTEREILLGMLPVRSGVYIIKVFSENGISDKKVVIK